MKNKLNQIANKIYRLDQRRKELLIEYQEAEVELFLDSRRELTRAEALQTISMYEICTPVDKLSYETLDLFASVNNLDIDDTDDLISAIDEIEASLLSEGKFLESRLEEEE